MAKKFFVVLIILFFPCFIFSSEWKWIKGGSFNDISVVSSNEIWLGGELIVQGIKDKNGKWTWSQKGGDITDTETVKVIDFYDSNHGIILTTNYIFYTNDSLNSWKKYPYPKNFEINNVQMIGKDTIIAVGSEKKHEGQAVIAKSIDDGETWNILFTSNSYFGGSFTDLKVLNNGVGFAVGTFYDGWGSYGVVYKTDDSWKNTYKIYQNEKYDLWGISAPSEDDIFVRGDTAVIHLKKVINNNFTYNSFNLNLPDNVNIFGFYFSDNTTGILVGNFENKEAYENGALILITTDGGNTFKRFDFSKGKSWIRYLNLIAVAGDDVFVGQTYRGNSYPCLTTIGNDNLCYGMIMKGSIESEKWDRIERLSGYIYSRIIPLTSNSGIQGYLVGTVSPGSLYSFIQRFNNSEIFAPSFIGDKINANGYISIDSIDMKDFNNGLASFCLSLDSKIQLLKTTDAGNTWTKIDIYDSNEIGAIDKSKIKIFNDEIWVKFNNGNVILRSYDYGKTWEYFSNGYGFDLDTMQVFNNTRYILANYSFEVSYDNGKTWNFIKMYSKINNALEDLSIDSFIGFQFFNVNNGIFWDKSNGYFYKTEDGGNTLIQLGKPKENPDFNSSFHFANERYGYISTFDYYSEIGKPSYNEYYFLKTEDGGKNWTKVNDGVNPDGFLKFKIGKDLSGIAYSPSGMILYRSSEGSELIKAYPDYALDGKIFTNNSSLIPNIKISIKNAKNVNIFPSMNILKEDVNKEVKIFKYIYVPSMNYWIKLPEKKERVSNIKTFNFYSGLDLSNLKGLTFYVYFGYIVDDKIVYNDYQVSVE